MKKTLLSVFVILTFFVYSVRSKLGSSQRLNISLPSNFLQTQKSGSNPSTNAYKDGVYIGIVADAYYGNVQVKAIISGGKITDVQFLDYPHDRGNSIVINNQAMPYLKSEAIQAQSAQVDIISGATQTSQAFIESLKAALSKANL